MLLERRDALERLSALLAQASAGPGRVALIGGEAGIGKTSLLREFGRHSVDAPVLWGACDPLATPRPLGPLHDMAAALGARVGDLLTRDAGRIEVFAAVADALGSESRCLVFEDVHWADEATLDLLVYLGRRVERMRTLLVASYRDDEVGASHPLRRVLGSLPGAARLMLAPLSLSAVKQLVGTRAIDAAALHRVSGGNPFFATELLAIADPGAVPPTVRDAVLARAARLAAPARAALEAAAVVGPRIEPALVQALSAADADAIEQCLGAGVLREAETTLLEFRHELARQAVLGSLSATRRQALHRRALAWLRSMPGVDLARLAHHAEAANDTAAVLEFAPAAARQAVAIGAHRQAHAQYARALRFADALPAAEQAALLELFAMECQFVGEMQAGIAARGRALECRSRLGDSAGQAENLCRLAVLLVQVGRNDEAERAVERALLLIEPLPPGRELASALRCRAYLYMLRRDNEQAIRWGHKALALAQTLGDRVTAAAAMNSIGAATIHIDYEAGCDWLERSCNLGLDLGQPALAISARSNQGSASGEVHRFEHADAYLADAIRIGLEQEMDRSYEQSWQALCRLHLGRWDEAGELALAVLHGGSERGISHNMAQLALGRLRARRGDAGVWDALDHALRLALASGHVQRVGPVRAARAEAAWLAGDRQRCIDEARADLAFAARYRHAWFVGELGYWLRVAGEPIDLPAYAAEPYKLQVAGDWRAAAAAWAALACPYERARALADGDAEAMQEALALFDRLGARPAAESLRRRLRDAGVRGVARGARGSTRGHPGGLTAAEMQVLVLLAQDMRNADIAARLHRSVRTVDHHVAAVLAKLGVASRVEAVRLAVREGWLGSAAQSGQSGSAI